MSPGEFAATVFSVAFAMLVVGLLVLVGSAIRTLTSIRGAVDDVRRTAVPLIADVHTAVRQAKGDLIHVEAIQGTVDSASRLALSAFATPVVKLAAVSTGISRIAARLAGRT